MQKNLNRYVLILKMKINVIHAYMFLVEKDILINIGNARQFVERRVYEHMRCSILDFIHSPTRKAPNSGIERTRRILDTNGVS